MATAVRAFVYLQVEPVFPLLLEEAGVRAEVDAGRVPGGGLLGQGVGQRENRVVDHPLDLREP
jgi:hypothetical protein